MDWTDATYLAAVSLGGAAARALARGLPAAWRLRLAAEAPDRPPGWIWLHAVSVGELLLADGILARFRSNHLPVHLTTGTPAGLDLLARRLPAWDRDTGLITGGAFPLDDPRGLRPFFLRPPRAFVALETELWPNLLRELQRRDIPRAVVNGRLTARSLRRGAPWMRQAAGRLSLVAARDEASAEAFRALGAPCVHLGGNLKADLPPPPTLHVGWQSLREAWAGQHVLVAGNTLASEESLVLAAWTLARQAHPGLRLILAPRQPRRFPEVRTDLEAGAFRFRCASEPWPASSQAWARTDILLLDTLGELAAAYGEGTVALVGGGWTGQGGHNPLEPRRFGLPTLIGPGYDNFQDLVEPLQAAGQLQVVPGDRLAQTLLGTLEGAELRPAARPSPDLPTALRGALDRTCQLLRSRLGLPID